VGYRLGKFLEDKGIIPLLVKYLHDERFENDDELRENCFQVTRTRGLIAFKLKLYYLSLDFRVASPALSLRNPSFLGFHQQAVLRVHSL